MLHRKEKAKERKQVKITNIRKDDSKNKRKIQLEKKKWREKRN